jgi:hypothetical protein
VDRSGLILAPRLLALVCLLLQPCFDGFAAIPHVAAHPIADGTVALVSPAVQGVNGDAQHLREIRERQQSVTGLECHDHLLSRGSQFDAGSARRVSVATWCSRGLRANRLGRAARPVEDLPTVNALSREAAAGGRQDQEQELNLSTVGRD